MAGAVIVLPGALKAWHEWGIRALVLLSFTLQVLLLVLAEFRRRVNSGALKFFSWSAYILADSTAIYVLGHMAVVSRSAEHELAAFWAPFLLLHLGGQDNITAYAIEDNQLWLRHLQTLLVQVAAAGYIVSVSSVVGRHSSLFWAAILMFLVGVVKYGERVWALRCASSSPVGKNYRRMEKSHHRQGGGGGPKNVDAASRWDTEDCLLMAHQMLGVPKELLLQGQLYEVDHPEAIDLMEKDLLYEVAEMQLSLMHDVLYTKAEVMHSWYGLCIHMLSPVFTAAALLLFLVLVGALALEAVSALRGIFSSWACVLLLKHSSSIGGSLGRAVLSLRRRVRAADWGSYWSGSMGQHNLLQLASRCRASKKSKVARWMGLEDAWNTRAYSTSTPVSAFIRRLVVDRIVRKGRDLEARNNRDGMVSSHFDSRGQEELTNWGLYDGLSWSVEEKILVWHIATNIYTSSWHKKQQDHLSIADEEEAMAMQERERADHLAEAADVLSSYMLYLLASCPYMLPGPTAGRDTYVSVCYGLITCGPTDQQFSSAEDLASFLQRYGEEEKSRRYTMLSFDHSTQRHLESILDKGCELGAKLVSKEVQDEAATLDLITQVWVETLCYASQQCGPRSHAKQLSNGGELITVAAILVEYFKQSKISFHQEGTDNEARETRNGVPSLDREEKLDSEEEEEDPLTLVGPESEQQDGSPV
ncbi:hypothetical protein U9M48_000495 [Paspalum notatum var. saurae]|uniref:DUF4220 domain-containing protein n=1 Tax=Paspalum notatum var. saurae TaxID=547442 RepID=A0AAQ3PMI2_PASNO